MSYRFTLEPYKSMKNIYHCPNCNKKTFTRYIDTETNEYLDNNVGRCSREIKCGYHYKPKDFFENNKYFNIPRTIKQKPKLTKTEIKISYIDYSELIATISNNKNNNNFIYFLEMQFGNKITQQLVEKYKIGTSNHWNKATIFWQIDINNKIRTGKVMLYDKNGSRVKKPYNHINWYHKIKPSNKIGNSSFNLKQCLFGEHLLKQKTKTVALVESEKTAIISSIFFPEFIWLATGGLSNLSFEKTKVLNHRNVILFPDLNALHKWKVKANKLSPLINIKIYKDLEKIAGNKEKNKGYDIADYLINLT